MTSATKSPKPRVILGLMTFGPDVCFPNCTITRNSASNLIVQVAAGARITELETFNDILDTLQSKGYNEIDTARMYVGGKQERFTQEANWKKRGLSIATKVWPNNPGDHSGEKLAATFETSLKELGTESVDILYLHAPDRSIPFAETLEAVDKLHKQ